MSRLPRGSCPVCGADVALRKGELVREHVDRRRIPELVTCEGSGLPNGCSCRDCAARRAAS